MPKLDRPALRSAARDLTAWWFLAVGAIYVVLVATDPTVLAATCAGAFLAMSGAVFVGRYRDDIASRASAAEAEAYAAQRAEQLAEHQRALAEITAAREALELERRTRRNEEVARGERCPDDCASCAQERTEADEDTRRRVVARVARHGHKPRETAVSLNGTGPRPGGAYAHS